MTDSPNSIDRNKFILGIAPLVPLSSPESMAQLRRDVRMAAWHNTRHQTGASLGSTDVLRSFLAMARKIPGSLKLPEAVDLLAGEIGKKLFDLLMKPEERIDLSLPMTELGLDSIVAVEMQAWWKLNLGSDITTREVMSMETLQALGRRAADGLLALHE